MDGKADWMAYGLPVEGEDGPFLGQQVTEVPTCDVVATVGDARAAVADAGTVIVLDRGLAVGEVDDDALAGHEDHDPLLGVLRPVPSTVRPSVTVRSVAEAGGGRRLVTTSDGRLLGQAVVEEAGDQGDHDHDHGDMEGFERELGLVMEAVEERFGDREPSEEELRSFLHERLVAEGRSPGEADRFLDELETGAEG